MSLKKSIRKLTALFATMMIMHSNCYMFGLGLSKVIAQDIKEPSINLSLENTQYIQFKEEIEKSEEELETTEAESEAEQTEKVEEIEKEYNSGVAIKTKVQLGLEEQETQLPIKSSEVVVSMPVINGYLPERATVVNANTILTNGESNNEKVNQSYDSSSGLLTVSYQNEETYSNYNKESKDEFEIIYIYPEQAYVGNEEEVSLQYSVSAKINFEAEEVETFSEMVQGFELKEKDNKGSLLSFGVTKLENDIYKGFMYSNVENGTNYDTNYDTISTLTVLDKDVEDELVMTMEENKFVLNDEEKTEISSEGRVLYKATQINKGEFDRIFGQDGVLELYEAETLLATVKYIEVSENEELIKRLAVIYSDENMKILSAEETILKIEYSEDVESLIIKTTKPIAEGYMNFKNENTIKGSEDYLVDVSELKTIRTTSSIKDDKVNVELLLLEPQTKVSVNSSNVNFSTLQTSKTTLTINLDSTNASAKLFNNPTITVKLPDGLNGGKLSSPEIVNGNGLTIKKATANNNIITIELEGKQTSYDLTNVSGGASIVMDIENIDFEDTIPTHTDKIVVTCVQNKEKINVSKEVNIISKAGLLMLTKVNNYDQNGTIFTTLDNNKIVMEIEEGADERTIEQETIFVNNYDKSLNNIRIIGELSTNDSTFSIKLDKEIKVEGQEVKVYYSKDIQATYDDESWTEEYTEDAKLYMIVPSNNELEAKESLKVKVSLRVPEKLPYNQVTNINTKIDYSYNEQQRIDINTLQLETSKVEMLMTNLNTNNQELFVGVITTAGNQEIKDGDKINEGQILKSKVTLVNNTSNDAVYKLRSTIENAVYYELYETGVIYNQTGDPETRFGKAQVGDIVREREVSIPAASTIELEYQYAVNQDVENVSNKINVLDTNGNNVIEEIKIDNEVNPAKMELLVEYAYNEEKLAYTNLNTILHIKNTQSKDLRNVEVKLNISNELTPKTFEFYGEQDINLSYYKDTKEAIINIDRIKENETLDLIIIFDVTLDLDVKEKEVWLNAICDYNGNIYRSNDFSKKVYQGKTDLRMEVKTETINEKLKVGDKVKYIVDISNAGSIDLTDSTMSFKPSEGMKVDSAEIVYNGNRKEIIEIDSTSDIIKEFDIKKEDKITFIYNISVEYTLEKMESEISLTDTYWNVITEKSLLEGIIEEAEDDLETSVDEKIPGQKETPDEPDKPEIPDEPDKPTNPDKPETPEDPDKPTNPDKPETPDVPKDPTEEKEFFTISGVAWLDNNKDGKRDEGEKLQSNIIVSLINMAIGDFATDSNGNRITTKTNSDGKYEFNNLAKGNYAVLFEFDTNTYTVTTYQKEDVSENINSDAILSTITVDGENKLAGLTDKINLTTNKENIDIGIIENAIFDLSLDKKITKITVIDKQGTEEYEYKDGHTAKVDLVAKYMNGANVIVNYKFTVKNEGDTIGYVDNLVDNLPSGLEFSSELNPNWYKDSDGNLYTNSLSGKAIKPGESVEVNLVLTKTMTEENAGTFVNSAKLEKTSNLENIREKENALENNESSAILIISIKTGSAILYISITTLCLAIICAGVYLIKKKVLNRGI